MYLTFSGCILGKGREDEEFWIRKGVRKEVTVFDDLQENILNIHCQFWKKLPSFGKSSYLGIVKLRSDGLWSKECVLNLKLGAKKVLKRLTRYFILQTAE